MIKLTKILLLSLLSLFAFTQTIFALNYKQDFPTNFYTKNTVPDLNDPLNYCEPWPGYDPQYLRLEHRFSENYLDFDCFWEKDGEKLEAKGGWILLKNETLPPPPPPKIPGCTNPNALNYNPDATEDNGTCQEKIEGCTDSTATNYNPSANVHKESMCQYPQNPPTGTPQDITGYIETSEVQKGATTWNITLHTNVDNPVLDISKIYIWNQFTPINATTNGKIITITLRQFDDQRLDVECNNYELTIAPNAISFIEGGTSIFNSNAISGNFSVTACDKTNTGEQQDPNTQNEDQNNQPKHENTIKESNFYLSLYDTDEKGKVYINLTNMIYILGFISFFLVLFFVLFGFIKNSFLGKSKR